MMVITNKKGLFIYLSILGLESLIYLITAKLVFLRILKLNLLVLVFYLPGYLFISLFEEFREFNKLERIMFSIALSVIINVMGLFVMNSLFRFKIETNSVLSLIGAIILVLGIAKAIIFYKKSSRI